MRAFVAVIVFAIAFLAVDLSYGEAQPEEKPEKLRVAEPKKWQAARAKNVHARKPPTESRTSSNVNEEGEPGKGGDPTTEIPNVFEDDVFDDATMKPKAEEDNRSNGEDTQTADKTAQESSSSDIPEGKEAQEEPMEQPQAGGSSSKNGQAETAEDGPYASGSLCGYCTYCKVRTR